MRKRKRNRPDARPFRQWLTAGSPIVLHRGVDYETESKLFAQQIRNKAKKYHIAGTIHIRVEEDRLVVRVEPREDDAEDSCKRVS